MAVNALFPSQQRIQPSPPNQSQPRLPYHPPRFVSPLSNHLPIRRTKPERLHRLSRSSGSSSVMDPAKESDIAVDFSPMIRIYKDGRIERLMGTETVPASLDPQNAVLSKDVVYWPENNLSVRLYIPRRATETTEGNRKLPLLVYFHGGGFIIGSPFSPEYHSFLTMVVEKANCMAVSVQYRRAPEHPIPYPYEDSWEALKWVSAHFGGNGPEDWLNHHASFGRVFFAGDSAGANIAHHMGMRAGEEKLTPEGSFGLSGIILLHPFFWGKDPVDEYDIEDRNVRSKACAVWAMASPGSANESDDPWLNVVRYGPSLAGLGCSRVLVFVAEKDILVRQGCAYVGKLKGSGWVGEVELVEAKGEEHVFHLGNPSCENAKEMMKRIVGFISKED